MAKIRARTGTLQDYLFPSVACPNSQEMEMYKILKRCRWAFALLAFSGFAQAAPLGHRWCGQAVGSFLARVKSPPVWAPFE